MKRINQPILQKGDIILTTSGAPESKAVRLGTNSDISHAMIYVANGSVMDSTMAGVHARNIQKTWYEDEWPVYVLRLKTPISPRSVDQVINYVRSQTATSYTLVAAVVSVFHPFWKSGRKQFCSRLVARAYASVGIELNGNPEFCTPRRLRDSLLLQSVDNPTVDLSETELEVLEQVGDGTKKMRGVINEVVEGARKIAPSIQSLNDIDQALIENMALDEQFAAIYQKSGYLDFWQVEMTKRPWRYRMELMAQMHSLIQKALPDDECLKEYCEQTVKDDAAGDFDHWMGEMDKYVSYSEKFPAKTFGLLRATYWNLIQSHMMRVTTANTYLRWRSLLKN
jgi:hypothetical protein